MTNDRKRIAAQQIHQALIRKGLSRKQLADMMGKNPSEITRWLSGEHNFTIGLLSQISEALDTEITGVGQVDGYATKSDESFQTLSEPSALEVMTLKIPSSCIINLQRRASRHNMDMESYAQHLLICDASKASASAHDFCGIWADDDFPTCDEMTRKIRAMRTSNKIKEL